MVHDTDTPFAENNDFERNYDDFLMRNSVRHLKSLRRASVRQLQTFCIEHKEARDRLKLEDSV